MYSVECFLPAFLSVHLKKEEIKDGTAAVHVGQLYFEEGHSCKT